MRMNKRLLKKASKRIETENRRLEAKCRYHENLVRRPEATIHILIDGRADGRMLRDFRVILNEDADDLCLRRTIEFEVEKVLRGWSDHRCDLVLERERALLNQLQECFAARPLSYVFPIVPKASNDRSANDPFEAWKASRRILSKQNDRDLIDGCIEIMDAAFASRGFCDKAKEKGRGE